MIHVALIRRRYVEMILAGEKRVECRLSRQRRDPFAKVARGEVVYIKEVGGAVRARGVIGRVLMLDDLTPSGVGLLRRRYNHLIRADAAFWRSRRHARYATLVWIDRVEACGSAPDYRGRPGFSPRSAWHVLDAAARRSA
jgi:hypothetical protein